jgi:putative nucleotidyltransferase with HDIG domain
MGEAFKEIRSTVIREEDDRSTVKKVMRMGVLCYEFRTPIVFADKELGAIYLGIDEKTLLASQHAARMKIALVSGAILTLGVAGVFFLSGFITTPVERLMDGVLKMKSGEYRGGIKVVSKDELGQLTRNFNEMASMIMDQKERLEHSAKELEDAYVSTVRILAAAIDARDEYTFGHSERVAKLSVLMGKKMGFPLAEVRDLEMVCLFHDVGKIKTPDRILHKMAPLNNDEYKLMMKHPEDGADILQLANSLQKHVKAVLHHHEWHNGEGYPHGLKDGQIPDFSAIIAIADAYDAMTSSRPYRKGMSMEAAVQEIVKFRGVQFNPEITDVFVDIMGDQKLNEELRRNGVYG